MIAPANSPAGQPGPIAGLAEVRYSLPALLEEVRLERNAAAYAFEKLDQVEIAKMFQKNRARRAPRPRK